MKLLSVLIFGCILFMAMPVNVAIAQKPPPPAPSGRPPEKGTPSSEPTSTPSKPASTPSVQEIRIVQTVFPGKFEPSKITVKRGIPVRIYMTTTQREHLNRVSILPFVRSSDLLTPGRVTIIEFTPDRVGEFKIRNIGHGFEATLIVED